MPFRIISCSHIFSLVVCLLISASSLWAREWKSADGKSKVEADFVSLRDGKVSLKKKSGEIVSVPLDKLSPADIAYVEGRVDSQSTNEVTASTESKKSYESAPTTSPPESVPLNSNPEIKEVESWKYLKFTRGIKLRGEKNRKSSGIVRSITLATDHGPIAYSPQGEFLAIAENFGAIATYDVNSASLIVSSKHRNAYQNLTALCFSADGKLLISGSSDGRIEVWAVSADGTLNWEREFELHTSDVVKIAISHDNKTAISCGKDSNVRIWGVDNGKNIWKSNLPGSIEAVWLSPDGQKALVAGGRNIGVMSIDLAYNDAKDIGIPKNEIFENHTFSNDGTLVAMSLMDTLKIYDTSNGLVVFEMKREDFISHDGILFDRDNRKLIFCAQSTAEIWDIATKKKLETIPNICGGTVNSIALSPDNIHFAVNGRYRELNVVRFGLNTK